jgi:glycosyltransferase involved in cell wall biosynthesis
VFFRHNRKSRFKAVHGFWALPGGLLAVLMGKFFGIKSMVSILGGDTISLPEIDYGQLRSFFYRKIVFWTLREADEVIALTRYLEKNLEAFGFRKTNIHIVPWGIDTRLFSYIEKPLENKVRFLHVGNLHPVKDQRTLLKAFKIVSDEIDAMLTIIGEGILADEIESVVGDLALYDKVKFINQQPYETLPSYYHAADVLLHTSLSEGQCEVVTEAMSSGLLVCGTRVGLMYDLPDCCIAVDVGDYKGLAAAILAILRNPNEIKRIKNNARRWSADHPIEWTAGQLSAFYLR